MKFIETLLDKVRPLFEEGGKLEKHYPGFEAIDTFLMTPPDRTKGAPHVRDPIDMKRVMVTVIFALLPCTLFGMYNAGYQALIARGMDTDIGSCFYWGAYLVLPIILTSYAVGGAWEGLFAMVRRHEINEGFLVTGILFPLTLPPTCPLWMVALGVTFGVVIGKEVFGGTGMNILNPALTARAFVFFAYPANMSGDRVWSDINKVTGDVVDGYSGATPLLATDRGGAGELAVDTLADASFSWGNSFLGFIPGSIGETSTLCCLIGAAILIVTGIGSWRIMAACVIGMVGMSSVMNLLAGEASNAFLTLPPWWHVVVGGFAFGTVFMATDPVSAPATEKAKWIYGILIGILAVLIRTINPAYPEGVMLSILFMNVFAPMIDHFVIAANIKRRMLRYAG